MKIKTILYILPLSIISGVASSDPITWNNVPSSRNSQNSSYKYQSNTGTQYKYNLNNAADRVRYGADPVAKIRDNINPKVRIDRNLNQYGGGAKW